MIVLKHAGQLKTVYLHLQRFAPGLRTGRRVRQGDVIGFVGATGLATGPHLHYGIKVRNRYVDPLTFEAEKGVPLSSEERDRFMAQLPKWQKALSASPPGSDSPA